MFDGPCNYRIRLLRYRLAEWTSPGGHLALRRARQTDPDTSQGPLGFLPYRYRNHATLVFFAILTLSRMSELIDY